MAEDLAAAERLPAAAPPAKRRKAAFQGRFLAAYLALGVLAGLGAAAGLVLFTGAERVEGGSWAAWEPVGSEATWEKQIADHVGRRYRLPSGDQIVAVVAGPPQVQSVSVSAVAIQGPNAASTDDIEVFPTEDTTMFLLCGLGNACAIREGEPTEERHRLLRRQGLELALYSFKYLGAESVIALLPPPADAESRGTALFLERKDFRAELDRPLAEAIAAPEAPQVLDVPEQETVSIDRLTRPFLFQYEFQALQNQNAVLVLAPIQAEE